MRMWEPLGGALRVFLHVCCGGKKKSSSAGDPRLGMEPGGIIDSVLPRPDARTVGLCCPGSATCEKTDRRARRNNHRNHHGRSVHRPCIRILVEIWNEIIACSAPP